MTSRYSSVVGLLDVHREIADVLDEACLATVGAPARAGDWIARLNVLLRWHIAGEDALLLPEYVALAPEVPPFGAPDILLAEHRRIEALLAEPPSLALLRRLHHVLEHHDEREARSLKPALDRVLPPERARRLLDDIEAARPAELDREPERVTAWSRVEAGEAEGDAVERLTAALSTGQERAIVAAAHALPAALDAELIHVAPPGDTRKERLLGGQQAKLRALGRDVVTRVDAALRLGAPRERLAGLVSAFDRLQTLAGLLRNYRGHAADQ